MKRLIKDWRRYWPYTKYAAKSGLKSEVASSHLSWLWWILDPILFMLVYWFIFMVIIGQKKEYFHIFVFVGLSMWNLFNKTVSGSVRSCYRHRWRWYSCYYHHRRCSHDIPLRSHQR